MAHSCSPRARTGVSVLGAQPPNEPNYRFPPPFDPPLLSVLRRLSWRARQRISGRLAHTASLASLFPLGILRKPGGSSQEQIRISLGASSAGDEVPGKRDIIPRSIRHSTLMSSGA